MTLIRMSYSIIQSWFWQDAIYNNWNAIKQKITKQILDNLQFLRK